MTLCSPCCIQWRMERWSAPRASSLLSQTPLTSIKALVMAKDLASEYSFIFLIIHLASEDPVHHLEDLLHLEVLPLERVAGHHLPEHVQHRHREDWHRHLGNMLSTDCTQKLERLMKRSFLRLTSTSLEDEATKWLTRLKASRWITILKTLQFQFTLICDHLYLIAFQPQDLSCQNQSSSDVSLWSFFDLTIFFLRQICIHKFDKEECKHLMNACLVFISLLQ